MKGDGDSLDDLFRLEREINEGINRFDEDEYYVAVRLMHIRDRTADGYDEPGLYRMAGFESWGAYCESDRIHVRRSHADGQIKYAKMAYFLWRLYDQQQAKGCGGQGKGCGGRA